MPKTLPEVRIMFELVSSSAIIGCIRADLIGLLAVGMLSLAGCTGKTTKNPGPEEAIKRDPGVLPGKSQSSVPVASQTRAKRPAAGSLRDLKDRAKGLSKSK